MIKQIRFSVLVLLLTAATLLAACGPLPAGLEVNPAADGLSAQVEFNGVVDTIAASQWTVQGQTILIGAQTTIDSGIVVGDMVQVKAIASSDGKVTASSIEGVSPDETGTPGPDQSSENHAQDEAEFVGIVEVVGADAWTVSGQVFLIDAGTEIKDLIAAGDTVKVHAFVGAGGSLTAREIELFDPASRDGQNPGPSSRDELEMTGSVEAIAADQWTISGIVFLIDAMTEIKGDPQVGDLVKVEALVGPDNSLTAREIKLPEDISGEPDATPGVGMSMEITGPVQALASDSLMVGGMTFLITTQTEIQGALAVGLQVKVEALRSTDGTLTAREIKLVTAESGSGSGGSGGGSEPGDDHGGGSATEQPDDHGGGKDDNK